jgi:hypothetical protein
VIPRLGVRAGTGDVVVAYGGGVALAVALLPLAAGAADSAPVLERVCWLLLVAAPPAAHGRLRFGERARAVRSLFELGFDELRELAVESVLDELNDGAVPLLERGRDSGLDAELERRRHHRSLSRRTLSQAPREGGISGRSHVGSVVGGVNGDHS